MHLLPGQLMLLPAEGRAMSDRTTKRYRWMLIIGSDSPDRPPVDTSSGKWFYLGVADPPPVAATPLASEAGGEDSLLSGPIEDLP